MSDKGVARRYAEALFLAAGDAGALEKVADEFGQVDSVFKANPDLEKVMAHRLLAPAAKQEVLRQIFAGRIEPVLLNFLLLLVAKRREGVLTAIQREFRALVDAAWNIVEAEVRSAVPLDTEQLSRLETALARRTGKDVRIKAVIDPDLKGGVLARVGDTIYDGSIVARLHSLKDYLSRVELG